jgi:hypothetical protein
MALVTITKLRNQPIHLTTDIKKKVHIHNEVLFSHKEDWNYIILGNRWNWRSSSEMSPSCKDKYYMFSFICGSWGGYENKGRKKGREKKRKQ